MGLPTDASYNSPVRTVYYKVDLYLNGLNEDPLEITRDNYLIELDLLEEATAGDTPFESVSSNELTLTLDNAQGLFNPNNSSSPYYLKMKRDVPLKVYTRTNADEDWYKSGEFYVTDWYASVTALTAMITANDRLYSVFSKQPADMQVVQGIPVEDFLSDYFDLFALPITFDSIEGPPLAMAFNVDENKEFITAIAIAYRLLCNVDHNGALHIKQLSADSAIRAILSDAVQLFTLDAKLTITSDYDAAFLTYYIPVESAEESMLSISEISLESGTNSLEYTFNKKPLMRLKNICLTSADNLCSVVTAQCTPKKVNCTVSNESVSETVASFEVHGTYVDTLEHTLGEEGENTLSVDNVYIQQHEYAQSYLAYLQHFIDSDVPVMSAQIRGNPLLEIGDKVKIVSSHYGVDFTGILIRQKFHYDGGLQCDITVLNVDLLGV